MKRKPGNVMVLVLTQKRSGNETLANAMNGFAGLNASVLCGGLDRGVGWNC